MAKIGKKKREDILVSAKKIAGERVTVTLHQSGEHWGLRLSGCFPAEGRAVGREICNGLDLYGPNRGLSADAGFICVWVA